MEINKILDLIDETFNKIEGHYKSKHITSSVVYEPLNKFRIQLKSKINDVFNVHLEVGTNSILEDLDNIINNRSVEKAKAYGPLHESFEKDAKLLTILLNKEITTRDFYMFTVVLKLGRLIYSDKYDTYLDLISYLTTMCDYTNGKKITD